jgi:SAM-dependent methyltransferase
MGIGSLDRLVQMRDLLRPDVDYTRPAGGGEAIFDLVGDLRGKAVLDIGCGEAPHRRKIEGRGARWVGVDVAGRKASLHADGDRLPFAAGAFSHVLCSAVLEHLPEPDSFLREMRRVLADGGVLFGYSAFLEPLHGMSYFHASHMGLEVLLIKHGFHPKRLWASHVAVGYQIETMLFPKHIPLLQPVVRILLRLMGRGLLAGNRWARELLAVSRGLSPVQRREERRMYRQLLSLRFACGFNFIAVKGEPPEGVTTGYAAFIKEG